MRTHPGHIENRTLTQYDGPEKVIHLVPWSIAYTGFKKTADQYYSGASNNLERASAESILDGVTEELLKDPKRKFTFSNVKYL